MVGQPLVLFLVSLEYFPLTRLYAAIHVVAGSLLVETSLNNKETRTVANTLGVDGVESALAGTEVIHGIEQVGFTGSVKAGKEIGLGGKLQRSFAVIPEIDYGNIPEVHALKENRFKGRESAGSNRQVLLLSFRRY